MRRFFPTVVLLAGCAHWSTPPPTPAPAAPPPAQPKVAAPTELPFEREPCTEITIAPRPADEARVTKDDTITLRRTACFGTCAIYSVTVTAEGHVTAVGERYVEHIGPLEWNIDASVARRLLAEAATMKIFGLDPSIEPRPTDLPSAVLTGRIAGRDFSIRHYGAGTGFNEKFGNRDAQTAERIERLIDVLSEAEVRIAGCVKR